MQKRANKQLDIPTIRSECSDSSFQRGKSYFDNKRVLSLHMEQNLSHSVSFASKVKGSHPTPYKQLVSIKWSNDFSQAAIIGRCSCPIGYNCKHVAAACLDYQNRLQVVTQPNSTACFAWLETLNEKEPEVHDPASEFLAYLLKPFGMKQELTVDFLVSKRKKTGGFNKGRSTNLGSLNYSFASGYNAPAYLQAADEEIIKLLFSLSNIHSYQPLVKGWAGGLALEKMLNTGRLFWHYLDGKPLGSGEMRKLDCSWQTDPQGNYRILLQTKPQGRLILTEPAYYLDSELGLLGKVDTSPLNAKQLRKLADAPPIPAQHAEQFSQRLIIDYPHINIPAPKKVDISLIDNLPAQPRLTLQGSDAGKNPYFQQLKLSFGYGPHPISAYQSAPFAMLETAEGYLRLKRDVEYEQECINLIRNAGFGRLEDPRRSELLFYCPSENPIERVERWRDFLQTGLPILTGQGWQVEFDSSFKMNFLTAANWEAEIEESGNEWFEMRFMVDIEGQTMPLLPLLLPVLENYELKNLPELLTLPLGDYNYVTLPSEKLKPFLAVLYEMFDGMTIDERGSLKLSRFDAAGLAELETHSYGLFSLKGGETLREIGRKIKDFSGIANVALPINLQADLRNYQQQGLNWLQFLREYRFGGILADDMGLGKTLQTLTHLLLEKQSGRMTAPCMIIAPTSLMSNWRREAARFTPDLNMLILQGIERKQQFANISDYDLVLTTYPLLPRDEEFLLAQAYYYLILDEAQIVKNPKAKAAKIVRDIKAEHRLCLTGTPMENHLGELWTQFDFLMPGFLGDGNSFKRRYRTPIEIHGDAELRQRLSKRIAPFMLRRTKAEVINELPPKTEIICAVPLGAETGHAI